MASGKGKNVVANDRESLLQRISELEKELYEYQHHMGLILIEKECSARIEKLSQGLKEAEEMLKREQSARLIAMSESESLKKALAERQLSEKNLSEKEANLLAWERKLEETQKRYSDRQESLNEIEDRINEKECAWN